jgi:hypothetical protein
MLYEEKSGNPRLDLKIAAEGDSKIDADISERGHKLA